MDLTVRTVIVIRKGQFLQMREEFFSQIEDDPLADLIREFNFEYQDEGTYQCDPDHQTSQEDDAAFISVRYVFIENGSDEHRREQSERTGHQHQNDNKQEFGAARDEIFTESFQLLEVEF